MKNPNIVFIMSDDHGQWSTGAYGNKEVITPNIDKLACEGIKFNNFFCSSPVCSPARASILTGKIPSQHGIHDWICGGNLNSTEWDQAQTSLENYFKMTQKNDNDKYYHLYNAQADYSNFFVTLSYIPEWKNEMRYEYNAIDYLKNMETYTNVLSENGYNVALSGKWHLGATTKKQCGFNTWNPVARGGTPYMFPEIISNGKVIVKNEYVTDIITANAIKYLNEYTDDKPFYLSIHYTAPHSPWTIEDQIPEIWNLYDDVIIEVDDKLHKDIAPDAPYPNSKEEAINLRRGYYSSITAMDKGIGDVLSTLEKLNLSKNTIVIYTSDNGISLGQHGVWGKGNGTFPLNFYEESIKVPFIYFDPRSNNSKVENNLISQYDIFPTIMDICNISFEFDASYPGSSFNNLLTNNEFNERKVFIYDEYGPNRMVRTNRYKYVHRYPYGPNELYDLISDPFESINLISNKSYKEIIYSMKRELEKWFNNFVELNCDGIAMECYGGGQFEKVDRGTGVTECFRVR